jgi:nucleoid DNA-binding protein
MKFETLYKVVKVKTKTPLSLDEIELIVGLQFKSASTAIRNNEEVRLMYLGSFKKGKRNEG